MRECSQNVILSFPQLIKCHRGKDVSEWYQVFQHSWRRATGHV